MSYHPLIVVQARELEAEVARLRSFLRCSVMWSLADMDEPPVSIRFSYANGGAVTYGPGSSKAAYDLFRAALKEGE